MCVGPAFIDLAAQPGPLHLGESGAGIAGDFLAGEVGETDLHRDAVDLADAAEKWSEVGFAAGAVDEAGGQDGAAGDLRHAGGQGAEVAAHGRRPELPLVPGELLERSIVLLVDEPPRGQRGEHEGGRCQPRGGEREARGQAGRKPAGKLHEDVISLPER